jgi:transposase
MFNLNTRVIRPRAHHEYWSGWRRRHQARARRCHYRRRTGHTAPGGLITGRTQYATVLKCRRAAAASRPGQHAHRPGRRVQPLGAGVHRGARRTLPGVGEFTALVMLAEIGDISRFGSARKLASWAGLTPTVRGSDLTVRHGHISKQGSAWLRWVMNQAAQTAKRSPEFAATYSSIAKRRGKKTATIAIARKLLTRAWHLLADMQATSMNEPPRRP